MLRKIKFIRDHISTSILIEKLNILSLYYYTFSMNMLFLVSKYFQTIYEQRWSSKFCLLDAMRSGF